MGDAAIRQSLHTGVNLPRAMVSGVKTGSEAIMINA
jgi:hypothetical protein